MTKKVFLIVILLVLALSSVAAQSLSINAELNKNEYFSGETIKLNVEIKNYDNEDLNAVLSARIIEDSGLETNTPSIEKNITFKAENSYSNTLEFPAFEGNYTAKIIVKDNTGVALSEMNIPFSVDSQPSLPMDMKTCKDENCNQESSEFLPNEDIYLVVNSKSSVEGRVYTPEGDSFELNFVGGKARITSDRIGEHRIVVSLDAGLTEEESLYFTIQEDTFKTPDNITYYFLMLFGILIVVILVIIYFLVRKK